MKLLEYLKRILTPEEYNRTVYRMSGYTDQEIKQLPPHAEEWLEQSDPNNTALPA